jgi:HEAT repeat protein
MNIEERERQRLAAIVRNRQDAEPIIAALRGAGFAVASVADLFNQKLDYRDAIPLLLAWLPRISNLDVKSDLIRALSVKWAKGSDAARMLVAEFEQAEGPGETELRWTIGNALEVLASDVIVDDLLRLATNRDYGRDREMVVMGLGKLKDPRVPDVLIGLLDDEAVVGHAVIALGKLRVNSARARLVSLVAHPKTWIRNAAKKAIERIDKA